MLAGFSFLGYSVIMEELEEEITKVNMDMDREFEVWVVVSESASGGEVTVSPDRLRHLATDLATAADYKTVWSILEDYHE